MSEKVKYYLLISLAVLVVLGASSFYVVPQISQAIVLQFGEPVRLVKEPGLKIKIPFIQNVVFYDNRLLDLDPPAQEVVLNDKKRLDVDSFTRFRIVEPLKFYQTVRTEEQARSKLKEIVNSSVRKILGRITLTELLSEKRTKIMADISEAVKADATQIGVNVADVRIRRADLPIEVLQAINTRMKAERERDAKKFRGEGQEQAQQIRAQAEKESTIILAEAEKKAQITRGEGDRHSLRGQADYELLGPRPEHDQIRGGYRRGMEKRTGGRPRRGRQSDRRRIRPVRLRDHAADGPPHRRDHLPQTDRSPPGQRRLSGIVATAADERSRHRRSAANCRTGDRSSRRSGNLRRRTFHLRRQGALQRSESAAARHRHGDDDLAGSLGV